jgi:hypothetical protein
MTIKDFLIFLFGENPKLEKKKTTPIGKLLTAKVYYPRGYGD